MSQNGRKAQIRSPNEDTERIIIELKKASKENIKALSRISIWNSIFTDCPLIAETKIRDHFNNIIRRHLIGVTSAQRFLFELAVFMIDLPEIFTELIDHFPPAYAIAGRIAYRATINSLEKKPDDAEQKLQEAIRREMISPPKELLQSITQSAQQSENLAKFVQSINPNQQIPKSVIEAILRCLSPPDRIRYSIMYGVPPPKINLNLELLALPLEFVEAISDIEGKDVAEFLVDPDDYI